MRRHKLTKSFSQKHFTRNATRVHPKNTAPSAQPMRGGIRL